ncbi:MAG: DNA-directed RNA polymerase subunit omega [Lachnospiraceae bacterium]
MLHPSYTDLMKTVNSEVEEGDTPVVNSRYSIVLATAKRARQLIAGEEAYVNSRGKKPLSIAVEEVGKGFVTIESEASEADAEDNGEVQE